MHFFRELKEEIGTDSVEIVAEFPEGSHMIFLQELPKV